MRKISLPIAGLLLAVTLFNCSPKQDTESLEEAKQEGRREAIDSMKKSIQGETKSESLYQSEQQKFSHPGFPGHAHDGTQKLSDRLHRGYFTRGVLAITDSGHQTGGHKIVGYLPFINPNNVKMTDTDRVSRPNHGHFSYVNTMTYIINENGVIIDSMYVAIITKRER